MDTNNMMNEKTELSQEELEQVAAGTLTPNAFKKWAYHAAGISTRYHTIDRDEFMFMGKPITYEQANQICRLASDVSNIINAGAKNADAIGKAGTYEEHFLARLHPETRIRDVDDCPKFHLYN